MTRFLYIFIINFADGYVKVPLQNVEIYKKTGRADEESDSSCPAGQSDVFKI